MLMKHNLKKNEKKKKVVFINGWRKMCSMVLIFSMAVSLGAGYVSSRRVEARLMTHQCLSLINSISIQTLLR